MSDEQSADQRTREETLNLALLSDSALQAVSDAGLWGADGQKSGPTASAHSAGERLDRYELVRPLGQGAFAEVWLAMEDGEHGFRKKVALKILKRDVTDDETFEALLHEARVCGHLHHTNVVDVYGVGQVDATTYIAMEYIDGVALDLILKSVRRAGLRVPLSAIIDLGGQVAAALDHAHNAVSHDGVPLQLVHRDLKPSNIIISADGVAKVTDFGLAKTTTSTQETEAGMLRGTPSYVAPEVWMGTREFRPAVDLFALGAILWEMAAGELLFKGELQTIIGTAINGSVEYDLQMLRLHQPKLSDVVRGLLQRKAEDRTQTAREVHDELQALYTKNTGPGGLRLFMSLIEALLDGEVTLDESTTTGALSGDEDWQRLAQRVGGDSQGGGVEPVPELAGAGLAEPGPTRQQKAPGQAAPKKKKKKARKAAQDPEPGSTRVFVGTAAGSERTLSKLPTQPRSILAPHKLLPILAGLTLLVAAAWLRPWESASSEPEPAPAPPAVETEREAKKPLLLLEEALTDKRATSDAAKSRSALTAPKIPGKKTPAGSPAERKVVGERKLRSETGSEKADTDADLVARSAVTDGKITKPPVPALKPRPQGDSSGTSSAPPVAAGCIKFAKGGLNSWIGGKFIGTPGDGQVYKRTPGVYSVKISLDPDGSDGVGVGGVRVKSGEMTTVLCRFGKSCKVTSTGGSCP